MSWSFCSPGEQGCAWHPQQGPTCVPGHCIFVPLCTDGPTWGRCTPGTTGELCAAAHPTLLFLPSHKTPLKLPEFYLETPCSLALLLSTAKKLLIPQAGSLPEFLSSQRSFPALRIASLAPPSATSTAPTGPRRGRSSARSMLCSSAPASASLPSPPSCRASCTGWCQGSSSGSAHTGCFDVALSGTRHDGLSRSLPTQPSLWFWGCCGESAL